jgi:6-methylsalicylate decarboxylase
MGAASQKDRPSWQSQLEKEYNMPRNRIDVHTHLVPPFWADELKGHGGDPSGWASPSWSVEMLLRYMDDSEIAISMLSLTAPGIEGWQGDARIDIARRVNDYGATLMRQYPTRFGYLCTLPMPDVDASLTELRRCFEKLGADGVCLHSNFDDRYLGEADFDPLWKELDRYGATVFLHPTTPAGVKVLSGQPSPMEDYPADTTKCAFDLLCSGHLRRFPAVRIVLSHGGGFLPYAATRLAELRASLAPERSAEDLIDDMRRFWFDTALVGASGLPSLLAFAEPGRIVFGTDFPYASEKVCKTFISALDSYDGLSAENRTRIDRGAAELFSRLKTSA